MSSLSVKRPFNEETPFDTGMLHLLFTSHTEELQRAKSQLLEAPSLATVGRMAYFISHDLCNYLSAIYSNVEFMNDSQTVSPDRELLFAEVRAAIHCMKDQLNSLLLFARTGAPLHRRPCSLNQLIQHAVRMVRQHPDTYDVDIIINETVTIEDRVDANRLGSAIYNLLLNACQAAQRGTVSKTTEITLHQEFNGIFIRFVDSGPGVPDGILETLFQPFVTEGKSSGMGLGLTIAEHVAREHGGDVYLEESTPGRTVFVLRLSKTALAE